MAGLTSRLVAIILLITTGANAQSTNGLPDAEIEGRQLAQEIRAQYPNHNFTNTGVLQIRDGSRNRSEIPIVCKTMCSVSVAGTNVVIPDWLTIYQATFTNKTEFLRVIHVPNGTNMYSHSTNAEDAVPLLGDIPLMGRLFPSLQVSGPALMSPFAGSDFWLCDLGLEFFHWPDQKILKKEVHRSRGCTVLESTNPDPGTNGYSRVVSWIDDESLGIVEANAYDAQGRLLKDFYPKDFKKVAGQWQVQTLVMENVRTGSRSRLEFDLKKQ